MHYSKEELFLIAAIVIKKKSKESKIDFFWTDDEVYIVASFIGCPIKMEM